ncbi:ZYRO0B17006p [Zygosaccharomyces rouxii]|uniref:ZYRO0B17006p n=1 Tax=Zygosaccharomyces rouxii (strain ATCC 2623 / CBS 732 / NBRC 1130 / NCYC 568 / NRRL Y-229) TaxID=559307 RepID=C5DSH4_ZYGRC|nr:uncharacterized protein ZYRO0B17006g [Zygosaccharomyces rouxii]KAH9198437.1 hypothetical protein LQ764DRAFT_217787 [Zygosaccharomyces rouxii]KAH9198444.1 hypothetical protein LQ764DRAFT_227638 [Zygosaccharomyces rouxii]KAH9199732.1 hypothetical protein LQ764DRAFT_104711 [Zygosaccharomyces rouxii]CAR26735.1 ZYRO0B17006p [Zygosaccharomyces rouxii]
MSMISDESEMDLEKCVQTYEEEEIELPADSSVGQLTYFLAPYFFEKKWISDIIASLLGAFLSPSIVRLPYFILRDFYQYPYELKLLDVLSPLWMIIHYFLCFTFSFWNFIDNRKKVKIEQKVLQQLLKEVAEMDLTGDPVAWQRIASRVNHFSEEGGHHYPLFYSEEHCMRFFVREIVTPIECQTYDIRCYQEGSTVVNFWKNPPNKALTERALANYNKCVESFGKLSHTAEKDEFRDGIFEKFHSIFNTSLFYLVIIELGSFMIMMLTFIISMISCAIFNSFATPH